MSNASVAQHRRPPPTLTGPAAIKTVGYLVSCVSVARRGLVADPGAELAGLLPALYAGMAASVAGMGLRWLSYELETRRGKNAKADADHAGALGEAVSGEGVGRQAIRVDTLAGQ
jgi:hypothetical protein